MSRAGLVPVMALARRAGLAGMLRLVDQLGALRDPAALPGWLATTTRRECGRVLRAAQGPLARGYELDAETLPDEQAVTAEQQLLVTERHMTLREALLDLPPEGQRLIALLTADPPVPYTEISARLGIPVGSIGPTRRRCLDKLRRHPPIKPQRLTPAQLGQRHYLSRDNTGTDATWQLPGKVRRQITDSIDLWISK